MSQGTGLPAPLEVPNSGRWLGNDGRWSAFSVHVGTPPQYFYVLPNFHAQTLMVPIDKDCSPERMNISDCGGQRGVEVFKSRPSLGFQKEESTTWKELGIYRPGLGDNLGLSGNAHYGYDAFGLGTSVSPNGTELNKVVISAYATPDFWVGQLGLSMFDIRVNDTERPKSLLARLKEEKKIPSLSFGYQAGAPYRYTNVPGSLILGGYDRSRQSNKTLLIPSPTDIIVGVQSISSRFGNGTSIDLLNNGMLATIETNTQDLWLPRPVCDLFAKTLGLTYFAEADRYVLTDAARAALRASSPTFSFTIGTSASGGATIKVDIPYSAFDLEARFPIFGSPTNYFPLRRAANDSQYALGRVFLQEIYLSVDWERDVFNISQAVFTSPPLPADLVTIEPKNKTITMISKPGAASSSKLSTGAIAGIAVGGALLILLLAGLGWWLYRRKQQKKKDAEASQDLPQDEKQAVGEAASGADEKKPPVDLRTDLELEGRMVEEMYAPHGHHEMHDGVKQPGHVTEVVEADSPSPIYELPSPEQHTMGQRN